jgi:hypothetical protein
MEVKMLRWISSRALWGALLIIGGILLLLQNLKILPGAFGWFWSILFVLGGAAFISVYYKSRDKWWVLIPGFTLLGLGVSSLAQVLNPNFADLFSGAFFLLFISLGFLTIFIVERKQWWAIIPSGVLLTLSIVSVIDDIDIGIDSGAVFFLGIGATFAILALLPGYEGMLRWAYIPAGILLVMGLLVSATTNNLGNLVLPAGLILVGLFFVIRAILNR